MTTPPLPQMPPQPPMGYAAPPPPGGGGAALQKIQGPAIGLLVVGILGLLLSLVGFVMNLLGTGLSGLSALGDDQLAGAANMFSGGLGMLFSVIGFCTSAFITWGAMQMKDLRNRTLSMAAAIVAMVPCITPCCLFLLGLPLGIWALITLNDPAVKGAFRN